MLDKSGLFHTPIQLYLFYLQWAIFRLLVQYRINPSHLIADRQAHIEIRREKDRQRQTRSRIRGTEGHLAVVRKDIVVWLLKMQNRKGIIKRTT